MLTTLCICSAPSTPSWSPGSVRVSMSASKAPCNDLIDERALPQPDAPVIATSVPSGNRRPRLQIILAGPAHRERLAVAFSTARRSLIARLPDKNCPVGDALHARILSSVPCTTTLPAWTPGPGPIPQCGPAPDRVLVVFHHDHGICQERSTDLACKASPTGQFLSGKRAIETPARRRKGNGKTLTVRGARENNLKAVDVEFPLGTLVAITGASGSGKSTLINEIVYKALWKRLIDTRTLPGDHDASRARSIYIRWSTSINRRSAATAGRIPRLTSASTTRSATSSRASQFPSNAATKRAASASTSRAADAKSARAKV